jgi:Rod binding domain-containing protein
MASSSFVLPAAGAGAHALASGKILSSERDPKLQKTAQDFETMFLENSFSQMFAGLQGEGPLGASGAGADIYRGMLTQEYAKTVAKSGGVGVSDSIYRELLKMQEGRRGGASAGLAAARSLSQTQPLPSAPTLGGSHGA